jgi:polyhydroxybutyrate depolymerase
MRVLRGFCATLLALSLAACSGGGYPYALAVPPDHDPAVPTALVVLLHGYSDNGEHLNQWMGMSRAAAARDILVAYPNGALDVTGNHYWNANDACCDFYHSGVDHVAYLRFVIADVSTRYAVDPGRVYVVGHSNGGFMAHRMACDAADVVSAVVAASGGLWRDASRCQPSRPVSVLEAIGSADSLYYDNEYSAGAMHDVSSWAAINACTGDLVSTGERLDLDATAAGAETAVSRYDCPADGAVELWTLEGVGHMPNYAYPAWADSVLDWLEAHRRQ